jgi:hypothetical protein
LSLQSRGLFSVGAVGVAQARLRAASTYDRAYLSIREKRAVYDRADNAPILVFPQPANPRAAGVATFCRRSVARFGKVRQQKTVSERLTTV